MRPLGTLVAISWILATLSGCGGDDLVLPGSNGPGDLVVVSGNGQAGETGTRLSDPLVVQVNDGRGLPAAGAEVQFAGSTGSPAVEPSSATTDATGRAHTRVTLGDAEGAQTVTAQLSGAKSGLSVEFQVTAVAPDPGSGGGGHGGRDHHGDDGHGGGDDNQGDED